MNNKIDILYLCDAEHNDDCPGKRGTGCHLNGGPCKYTRSKEHAGFDMGIIMVCELEAKLPALLEDYYQKWAYLTPEVVMKIIRGEEV